MATNEPCCGHDHVGADELWLTADELVGLIDAGIAAGLGAPQDASPEARRAAIRRGMEQHEAAPGRPAAPAPAPAPPRPKSRGQRHDEWAARIWG